MYSLTQHPMQYCFCASYSLVDKAPQDSATQRICAGRIMVDVRGHVTVQMAPQYALVGKCGHTHLPVARI